MDFQELIKKGYIENDPEEAVEMELAGYWEEAGDYHITVRSPLGGSDLPLTSIQLYEDGEALVCVASGLDHTNEYLFDDNDIPVNVYKLIERG